MVARWQNCTRLQEQRSPILPAHLTKPEREVAGFTVQSRVNLRANFLPEILSSDEYWLL